jgi:transcriptional regulator with XRE-family HTH domain
MKSPNTGKEMTLTKEKRSMDFRKETFTLVFHHYKCLDFGEEFTDESCDLINTAQLYNLYRNHFNIPFAEEIIQIREAYGVSASKMSAILGFGINSYRQYEAGEIPSISNARLIQLVNDPAKFIQMVELCHQLDSKTKIKYIEKAESLLDDQSRNSFNLNLKAYLLGHPRTDIFSGYKTPNFEKITEMVVYFAEHVQPYKTKMNKLLFYSDFLMFKKSSFSIGGLKYLASEMGPVPINFQSLFEFLSNRADIEMSTTELLQGYTGEQFKTKVGRSFKSDLFTKDELEILKKVATVFKFTSNQDIIALSQLELAWRENKKHGGLISYEHAYNLHPLKSQK